MRDKTKVFEIGLGRSGTRSLAHVARQAGYSVCHGAPTNRQERLLLSYLLDGGPLPPYIQTHEYVGAATPFWGDAADRYPDALFLLPMRPLASWLRSCKDNFSRHRDRHRLRSFRKHKFATLDAKLIVRQLVFGTVRYDRHKLISRLRRHHRAVRDRFKLEPHRLVAVNLFTERPERVLRKLALVFGANPDELTLRKIRRGSPSCYPLFLGVPRTVDATRDV